MSHSRRPVDEQEGDNSRLININDTIKNMQKRFVHNSISTAKYNPLTFLPKFLYEQFSKTANMFFLFIALIQQIDGISPTNKYATVFSLTIVIAASAAKELVEDFRRQSQDTFVNSRAVRVLSGSEFVTKQWKDVVVGDTLRVENGDFFPADLILLSSSEPDALCYIETSNLDGETNLKIRQGLPETAVILDPKTLSELKAVIKSEQPNSSLYTYEGTLRIKSNEIPLNPDQLLLRGAMLRNTRWVYGTVVFTGHETKLMRNSTATPIKSTKLSRNVNKQIIYLFTILASMAVICSFGTFTRSTFPFEIEVILASPKTSMDFLLDIFTFMILFNNLIPLRQG